MNEVYSVPQIRSLMLPVLTEYNIRRAVLFGSYGKNCATPDSDIDLLVDSGLRGLKFVALLDKLQTALGKDVDLFDTTHIIPGSEIDREIRRTGVELL